MARNKKKIIRSCTVSLSIDFFDEIMRKMRQEGYEMIAVTSPGPELDKLRTEDGFKCIGVPMERHISLFKDFISLLRMIKVFWKERPYIVHSMTPKAGLVCMIAAKLTRVPIRIHTFTGLVWPTAVGKKRKLLMAMDKLLCSCATHIIPEGQGVLNDLKDNGVCKKPMKVLGYGNVKGVDLDRFDPARFQTNCDKDSDTFVFLFVGRIVGDKGINELVDAFARLHDKYAKTKLVLVGRYENDLDPVSETTRHIIDINPAIEAVGEKFGDDLLQMYVDAHCFVMPSYREGFPNTVLEAGAMGLPCIVTDINGSREIITEGVNGMIVPSKDAEFLYKAMSQIVNNRPQRNQMSVNARKMIADRFEQGFVQQCLIDYYKERIHQ